MDQGGDPGDEQMCIRDRSTRTVVEAQAGHLWQWNAIRLGVVPFIIFFIAIIAETNRPPFDLVEADSELVGGFVTEYSSIRFALFFLAEFMNTITMSAVVVTLFFGCLLYTSRCV